MKNKKSLFVYIGIAIVIVIVILVLCIKFSRINKASNQASSEKTVEEIEESDEVKDEEVEESAEENAEVEENTEEVKVTEEVKKEVKEGRVYTGAILKAAKDDDEVLEKWNSLESVGQEETPGVGEEEMINYPTDEEEQDLVLENGNFLFLVDRDEGIRIVENSENGAVDTSVLKMENEQDYIRKATIRDNLLLVICDQEEQMAVYLYDITDAKAPKLKSRMVQDGNYYSFRIVENSLYLFSQTYQSAEESYIPLVQGEAMKAEEIYLPKLATSNSYLIMTATSMENLAEISDKRAVLSIPTCLSITDRACYLDASSWDYEALGSCLVKIEFGEGKFHLQNSVQLAGYITDSGWFDQRDDVLRVFTTVWDGTQTNRIYMMDENMSILGKCEQIAENEIINAVRFTENTAYLVVDEAKEPLVAVDLTNPEEMVVADSQKISGFEDALYNYGTDEFLGISWEKGIKLCMYNMKEEPQVEVLGEYQISEEDSDMELANNQVFYISQENNRIGLALVSGEQVSYQLFSYDEKSNTLILEQSSVIRIDLSDMDMDVSEIRGILVGNNLYIVRNLSILGILFDVQK